MQSARDGTEYEKQKIAQIKNRGTDHQFMVLSRNIGVEMVPG